MALFPLIALRLNPGLAHAGQGRREVQVTNLPLDVALYRLAPDGRSLVAAIIVHAECDTLACSKAKDEAKAKEKTTGIVYDSATPRFWDTYLDGRYIGSIFHAA